MNVTENIQMRIDSATLNVFDFEKMLKKNSLEFIQYMQDLTGVVEAYESFVQDLVSSFGYTLDISSGEGDIEWIFKSMIIEVTAETDVSTIFDIHRDVYTKYKEKFKAWLDIQDKIEYDYPDTVEDFFKMLEGRDVSTAVATFFSFLISEELDKENYDYLASKFVEDIDNLLDEYWQ